MFKIFRKKTQLEKLIATDGIEHATDRFAQIISSKIPNKRVAYQFILEELDGARQGNSESQAFARNSGIPRAEYLGALANSIPEVDGPDGPQQLLMALSLQISDQRLMAEFRCKVDDKIMRTFRLGNYSLHEEEGDIDGDSEALDLIDSDEATNYTIEPNGFIIKDRKSGDGLTVVIKDGMFQGTVMISDIGATAGLAPWSLDANPFEDDNHFFGSGMSPQGQWSFSVRPSVSFSRLLREAKERYVAA